MKGNDMLKLLFTFIIFCFLLIQLSPAQTMKVHTNSGVSEFNLSDIDSITFTIIDTTNLNLGLMAYYPFNGNANDESGNGNDGIIFGAALTNDRSGNPNSAYYFDGIDDYIDISNSSTIKPPLPVSFACWININPHMISIPIFTNNIDATRYFGVFGIINSSNNVQLYYGDGIGVGYPFSRSKISSSSISTGIWYHIVGIIRGPQDMDIYINGVNDGGTYIGSGGPLAYNTEPGNIGRHDSAATGPPYYYIGVIDELRIYNRVLTEAEIQALYILY
jgi:hypothetical protein